MTQISIDTSVPSVSVDGVAWGPPVAAAPAPAPTVTVSGGNMASPTTQAQLQALLTSVAQNGGTLELDGSVPPIQVSSQILMTLATNEITVKGNQLRLQWTGSDDVTTAFRVTGSCKRFTFEGFDLYGNGYTGAGCGNGFQFDSMIGGGAQWYIAIRDLYANYCMKAGFLFEGNEFEGSLTNLIASDCAGDGFQFSDVGGVESNLMVYGLQSSRNAGWGINMLGGANSVDLFGASLVLNGAGGINAPNGFRTIMNPNGENTGKVLINIPFSPFPSLIVGANLSSEGITVNGQAKGALPSQYLIKGPAGFAATKTEGPFVDAYGGNVSLLRGSTTYYGTGTSSMAVLAP